MSGIGYLFEEILLHVSPVDPGIFHIRVIVFIQVKEGRLCRKVHPELIHIPGQYLVNRRHSRAGSASDDGIGFSQKKRGYLPRGKKRGLLKIYRRVKRYPGITGRLQGCVYYQIPETEHKPLIPLLDIAPFGRRQVHVIYYRPCEIVEFQTVRLQAVLGGQGKLVILSRQGLLRGYPDQYL